MKDRVLYCLGGVAPSGAETRLAYTALAHYEMGSDDVSILVRQSLYTRLREKGITLPNNQKIYLVRDRIGLRGSKTLYLVSFFIQALKLLIRGKLDVVHVSIFNPLQFIWLVPLVRSFYFEVTSPDVADQILASSFLKLVRRYSLPITYICVSRTVRDRIACKELVGEPVTRSKPFCRYVPDGGILKKKSNLVVYAHRLIKRKHPLLAAKAFVELAKKMPNWDFMLYGCGDLEIEVMEIFKSAELSNAAYLGYQADLSAVLNDSKIFVSLISPDNYPSQSILEAMSCGNALLLSDQGMTRDMFIRSNGKVCELELGMVIDALGGMIAEFDDCWCEASQTIIVNSYSFDSYFKDHLSLIGCSSA